MISYNGGCINRVGDDTPIISSTLPFETIRSIFEWSKDKTLPYRVSNIWDVPFANTEEKEFFESRIRTFAQGA